MVVLITLLQSRIRNRGKQAADGGVHTTPKEVCTSLASTVTLLNVMDRDGEACRNVTSVRPHDKQGTLRIGAVEHKKVSSDVERVVLTKDRLHATWHNDIHTAGGTTNHHHPCYHGNECLRIETPTADHEIK
jgi:hypothetical protein